MNDYIEIMNFCGYDLAKANEMANQSETKTLVQIVEETLRECGLERIHAKEE